MTVPPLQNCVKAKRLSCHSTERTLHVLSDHQVLSAHVETVVYNKHTRHCPAEIGTVCSVTETTCGLDRHSTTTRTRIEEGRSEFACSDDPTDAELSLGTTQYLVDSIGAKLVDRLLLLCVVGLNILDQRTYAKSTCSAHRQDSAVTVEYAPNGDLLPIINVC